MIRTDVRGGLWLSVMLLAAGAAVAAEQPARPTSAGPGASIVSLSWLAGCWESTRGERRVEEQWMTPRGGTMLGMSRTVGGDRTREFEFMQIRENEGRLVFTAKPSGQEGASFDSIEVSAAKVVFENAAHDFPQRIIYKREEDGSLLARIEGQRDGKLQGIDYPMRRSRCVQDVPR